jgi:hypothetical protein
MLALTSSTSGGCSVDIVRSRTHITEYVFVFVCVYDVSEAESTSVIRYKMGMHPTHFDPLDSAVHALPVACCLLVLSCLIVQSEDRRDVSPKCQTNFTR